MDIENKIIENIKEVLKELVVQGFLEFKFNPDGSGEFIYWVKEGVNPLQMFLAAKNVEVPYNNIDGYKPAQDDTIFKMLKPELL